MQSDRIINVDSTDDIVVNTIPTTDECNNKKKKKNIWKVVCVSDTHGKHWDLQLPKDGDILIHAGDFAPYHKLSNEETLLDFDKWLGTLTQFKTKIVVCGNHDKYVEYLLDWQDEEPDDIISNGIMLHGYERKPLEIVASDGSKLNIFGAPWY